MADARHITRRAAIVGAVVAAPIRSAEAFTTPTPPQDELAVLYENFLRTKAVWESMPGDLETDCVEYEAAETFARAILDYRPSNHGDVMLKMDIVSRERWLCEDASNDVAAFLETFFVAGRRKAVL